MHLIKPTFKAQVGINDVSLSEDSQESNVITGSCVGYIDLSLYDGGDFNTNVNRQAILLSQCGSGEIIFDNILAENIRLILQQYDVSPDVAKAAATLYQVGLDKQALTLLNVAS